MADRGLELQGYRGDAGGLLVCRNSNELLISVTLNGNPTNVALSAFRATPMLNGVLPAKVVSVNEYAGGALGLSLSQQRIMLGEQVVPGAQWPNGPVLFRVVVYWPTSDWGLLQAACLATAHIENPHTVEERFEGRVDLLQEALQRSTEMSRSQF